jgi:hypothetical protein
MNNLDENKSQQSRTEMREMPVKYVLESVLNIRFPASHDAN